MVHQAEKEEAKKDRLIVNREIFLRVLFSKVFLVLFVYEFNIFMFINFTPHLYCRRFLLVHYSKITKQLYRFQYSQGFKNSRGWHFHIAFVLSVHLYAIGMPIFLTPRIWISVYFTHGR